MRCLQFRPGALFSIRAAQQGTQGLSSSWDGFNYQLTAARGPRIRGISHTCGCEQLQATPFLCPACIGPSICKVTRLSQEDTCKLCDLPQHLPTNHPAGGTCTAEDRKLNRKYSHSFAALSNLESRATPPSSLTPFGICCEGQALHST